MSMIFDFISSVCGNESNSIVQLCTKMVCNDEIESYAKVKLGVVSGFPFDISSISETETGGLIVYEMREVSCANVIF